MSTYSLNIQNALDTSRAVSIPSIKWLVVFVCVFVSFYIFIAILIAPEKELDYHFAQEEGAVTALSAVLLAMASGLAWTAYFLSTKYFRADKLLWLVFALGFLYFALDELLQFHEGADNMLVKSKIGSAQFFRNWNDLIVISYGVIALAVVIYMLPKILGYPLLLRLLAMAFVFYFLHTVIDSFIEPKSETTVILEESCKLFSSAFLAVSMITGLLGVIGITRSSKAPTAIADTKRGG